MVWNNPPKLKLDISKTKSKVITPEQLSGGSESSHQKALFAWAALSNQKYPQLRWMFAIPNGGSRHIVEAANLKAAGVKAGVPDIFLPFPLIAIDADHNNLKYTKCNGLFIELKVGKNKASEKQLEWIDYLQKAGYYCKVCYDWEEARDCIINYLEGRD